MLISSIVPIAPSHIFNELWMMSFLKHKVSVFGVDLDRGKKRQKVREGPLTCFATFAVIYSITL